MDQSRRDLLKVSAAAVGSALMGVQSSASAQQGATPTAHIKLPLSGQPGIRLATCVFKANTPPRIAIVLSDGRATSWRPRLPASA